MKWSSHKVITFSVIYLLTDNVLVSFISSIGSILPDLMEGRSNWSNPRVHRTVTHWIFLYLPIIVVSYFMIRTKCEDVFCGLGFGLNINEVIKLSSWNVELLLGYMIFWLGIGAVMHILEDGLTGGIPIWKPCEKKRWFVLFKTGSLWEEVLVISLILLLIVMRLL